MTYFRLRNFYDVIKTSYVTFWSFTVS